MIVGNFTFTFHNLFLIPEKIRYFSRYINITTPSYMLPINKYTPNNFFKKVSKIKDTAILLFLTEH